MLRGGPVSEAGHDEINTEEVLAEFLATELYPEIATEFEQVPSEAD